MATSRSFTPQMVSKASPAARVRWLIPPISDSASATDSSNSLSLVSRSITGVFMLPVFWTDRILAAQKLRIAAHFLRGQSNSFETWLTERLSNRREAKHQKLRMPRLPMMEIDAEASDVLAAHVAPCVHQL